MDKFGKRRAYNRKWISSKRREQMRVKQRKIMELEILLDISSDENDDGNTQNELTSDIMGSRIALENDGETSNHVDDHLKEQNKHEEAEQIMHNSDVQNIGVQHTDSESGHNEISDDIVNFETSSTHSDDERNYDCKQLRESLKNWVNTHEIRANSVDSLLKILRDNGYPDLPISYRTLLRTPRDVDL